MTSIVITIDADGTLRAIHTPQLPLVVALGGTAVIRRASHVEPCAPMIRFAFHALRRVFGEHSRVGRWTCGWLCNWRVRFAGDRHASYAHPLRSFCIAWEIEELNRRALAANGNE